MHNSPYHIFKLKWKKSRIDHALYVNIYYITLFVADWALNYDYKLVPLLEAGIPILIYVGD